MEINNENIETYILLLADKELDEAEERAVRLYIDQNDACKPMLEAYMAAHLDSSETFIFPDKESLLQPETMVMPLRPKSYPAFRIAATVAVLLGLGVATAVLFSHKEAEVPERSVAIHASESTQPSLPAVALTDTLAVPVAHTNTASHKMVTHTIAQAQQNHTKNPAPVLVAAIPRETQVLPQLENTTVRKMQLTVGVDVETIVMVEKNADTTPEVIKRAIPGWLPVNEENLQGVNAVIAHIQGLKENIQQKAQALKNTAFVIRIGDKQIPIGRSSTNN